MATRILGNQTAVTTKIGEVTQGIGFEQLPVDSTESGFPVGFIDYETGLPNPAYQEGRVFYDDEKNALSYYNNISDTTINLGQETVTEVCNSSGGLISNGAAVRVVGSMAGLPCIIPTQADTVANATVAGVATHDIPDGESGYITIFGSVGGLDTSMFTEGDVLYLSESVAGELVTSEQQILSPVALVLTMDATEGTIVVRPRGVVNLTATDQVIKASGAVTQGITTTPVPLAVFGNLSAPALNVTTTFTAGSGQFEARFQPASEGASGFYEVSVSFSGNYTSNTQDVVLTVYVDGAPTILTTLVPFDGVGNGDSAAAALTAITPTPVSNTGSIEIYVNASGGTGTLTCLSCVFNCKRLGNA